MKANSSTARQVKREEQPSKSYTKSEVDSETSIPILKVPKKKVRIPKEPIKDEQYYYFGRFNLADIITGVCAVIILAVFIDAWLPKG